MKPTIWFSALLFLLFGCSCSEKEGGDPDPDLYEPRPVETAVYKGIASVKLRGGDPCKNAMIRVYTVYEPYKSEYFADTTGTIIVAYDKVRYRGDPEFAQYELLPVEAYMDTSKNFFLISMMQFIRVDIAYQEIPITEVVFADSLAQE